MIRLLSGDCRDVLAALPADSVQCVVTSPPYYGLRSYLHTEHPDKHREIGSECTPDEYLATMVAVFREVRRVLRPDGTCWVNIGDSFSGGNNVGWRAGNPDKNGGNSNRDGVGAVPGLAAKQLLMMPARLALALQADGWWLRSDIIWHKPNPMPESVTDRPTSAHEHVFLLTKSARYFYDNEAIRENATADNREVFRGAGSYVNGNSRDNAAVMAASGKGHVEGAGTRSCRNVWTIATASFSDWGETVRQVRVAWDAGVDGMKRKASPDCPVHADRPALAPTAFGDAHADDLSSHIARIGADLAQAKGACSAPIDQPNAPLSEEQSSDLPLLACLPVATPHSSQSHRTGLDPATSQPCSVSGETDGGIGRISAAPERAGSVDRTLASNSAKAELGDNPSSRTADCSAHTPGEQALSSASDPSNCTCEWYIKKTEKTSHFATFPPALAERCIRAGTSERGCCSQCGKPWVRTTERGDLVPTRKNYDLRAYGVVVEAPDAMDQGRNRARDGHRANMAYETTTTGWRAGCDHEAPVVPCTVLDPFAGAGTTLLVADRLQRDAIGIELNTAYTEMAMERCRDDAPLFVDAPAADPEDARMADLFAEAAE